MNGIERQFLLFLSFEIQRLIVHVKIADDRNGTSRPLVTVPTAVADCETSTVQWHMNHNDNEQTVQNAGTLRKIGEASLYG